MKFHKFPKDEQVCIIKFESFSYSTDQMNMKWLDESLSQVSSEFILYCKINFGIDLFRSTLIFTLINSITKLSSMTTTALMAMISVIQAS